MKNKEISHVIRRKDMDADKRLKMNKSIRVKLLLISVFCLVITSVFTVVATKAVKEINIATGISKSENKKEKVEDTSIHIDLEEVYYVKNRGRREINTLKVVETIFIIGCSVSFYALVFFKMTSKMMDKISSICNALDNMADGEYSILLDDAGDDELSKMSADVNMISDKFSKILEEERATEAAKNELITSIAHDLRTPITSIIGYLELIISKDLDDDTKNNFLRISYDKSKRLEHLIEDLFTYTKFSFGQYPLNYEIINLGKLMEQLVEEFYPQFMDEDIEYTYKCDKTIMINADGELLARLFANLLSNSIKYGKDGKNIDIEVDSDNDTALVKVTNYGQVIPKEEVGKIFEKFYRIENSRSRNTGGTGLGLAIVRQIAELHKGTIEADSGNNGTVFCVRLPLNKGN